MADKTQWRRFSRFESVGNCLSTHAFGSQPLPASPQVSPQLLRIMIAPGGEVYLSIVVADCQDGLAATAEIVGRVVGDSRFGG